MTLQALQLGFRDALLGHAPDAGEWLGETPPSPGLKVYHFAYRAQLTECLRESFEKLHAWLGDDAFTAAALVHIADHPPHGWTLDAYGDGFDLTLRTLYPDDPEVAEMAWLERALSTAFSGTDAIPLSADTIAAVDWDNACLEFAPTLQRGGVTTNVGAIWSALSADAVPPAATALPELAELLVWRQDYSPCFRTIDKDEGVALVQMLTGTTFGELCFAQVEKWGAQDGINRAGMLLGQWLHDGLVTGLTDKETLHQP